LNSTFTSPCAAAAAVMAAGLVASSVSVVQPVSAARVASASELMSVAMTRAPSRA